VNDVAEALSDPQVLARGMIAEIEGKRVGPASALKFGEPQGLQRAPGLGEHTGEVLAGIGVREDELAALKARGVV
jgi:crotonobetainyl-CoA:carnitine CoA-transferase CaiB-like acyl-CoA transferase